MTMNEFSRKLNACHSKDDFYNLRTELLECDDQPEWRKEKMKSVIDAHQTYVAGIEPLVKID